MTRLTSNAFVTLHLVFALACGDAVCEINLLGAIAADLVARATVAAIEHATSLHGVPCRRDLTAG